MKRHLVCLALAFASPLFGAGLDFSSTLREVKAPPEARTVAADYTFTNTSDHPITIREFDAGCSCIGVQVAEKKLTYQAGESGTVRATFDVGVFSGTVDKHISIWLQDDPEETPSVNLTMRIEIPVLVEMTPSPATLKWALGAEPTPQTIKVRMNGDSPIHILDVRSSIEDFKADVATVTAGEEYVITVTPLKINTPGLGIIRFTTDCKIERHRVQQAFAVVRKPIAGE